MRASELITEQGVVEAENRANTVEHLLNRINVAAKLCDPMGDRPLLFRDFKVKVQGNTVLNKISNDYLRGPYNVLAGPAGAKQWQLLELLDIKYPVFTKMIRPDSNRGPFGDAHIFIPPSGSQVRWSPRVKDFGSQRLAEELKGSAGPGWEPANDPQVNELAKTYLRELPDTYTDHEIIFDCKTYYLVEIQTFLQDFAGKANKEFLEKSRYSNVKLKINPELFNARISNYNQLAWYLRNTATKFLEYYQSKVDQADAQIATQKHTTNQEEK